MVALKLKQKVHAVLYVKLSSPETNMLVITVYILYLCS